MLEHLLNLAQRAEKTLEQVLVHKREAKKLAKSKCHKPFGPKFNALVLEHLEKMTQPKAKEEETNADSDSKRRAKSSAKSEQSS